MEKKRKNEDTDLESLRKKLRRIQEQMEMLRQGPTSATARRARFFRRARPICCRKTFPLVQLRAAHRSDLRVSRIFERFGALERVDFYVRRARQKRSCARYAGISLPRAHANARRASSKRLKKMSVF